MFDDEETFSCKIVDLSLAIMADEVQPNSREFVFDHFTKMLPLFWPPELFSQKKNYSKAVDIWSCGCIIFNMMTGVPPFYEEERENLMNAVQRGNYAGMSPDFDANGSKELKELLAGMIVCNPLKRITADDLVQNKWIGAAHQKYRGLSKTVVKSAFQNMRSFQIGFQLQRAALMHMAKVNILKFEKDNLKMIFDALDEEKDGEIVLAEFLIQLKEKFDIVVQQKEMEAIMKQCDLDYDGKIQFSEFLVACCNKRALFCEQNLKECFYQFDANGDGQITEADLQVFMGNDVSADFVSSMMFSADKNADGSLDLSEFSNIMLKILISTERNR